MTVPGYDYVNLPPVDSGDVSTGGYATPMPEVPQDFAGDGMSGYIGQVTGPDDQGTDVVPPFATQSNLWPSEGEPPNGNPAGQAVGPYQGGAHMRPGTGITSDTIADGVAAAVAASHAQQAAFENDLAEQGNAAGDQIDIPAAYTPASDGTLTTHELAANLWDTGQAVGGS